MRGGVILGKGRIRGGRGGREGEAWTLGLSEKQERGRWWGKGREEREGARKKNKEREKEEIEGEQKWPSFPFRESNQIPLIAHYLKRLSGAVMRLHAGLRLRDFLVYRCWRVL